MSDFLTPAQLRGARGMLGWSMLELAKAAGLSVSTVKRMEMATRQPVSEEVHGIVRRTLETAGVRFLDDVSEGWGLRLRR